MRLRGSNRRGSGFNSYGNERAALRQHLQVPHWHISKKGERVVRGPDHMITRGTVNVRVKGEDVPVEVGGVSRSFSVGGVRVRYGYPAETPGQRVD